MLGQVNFACQVTFNVNCCRGQTLNLKVEVHGVATVCNKSLLVTSLKTNHPPHYGDISLKWNLLHART